MAKVVQEVERDNRIVLVYDNGMERWKDTGRIIKSGEAQRITKANTHELLRKRQEKAASLLRQAIITETMDKLDVPAHGPAAAIAAAGGILWREIVLDPNAYPRDRMEAWEKLGKYSGILSDPKQQAPEAPNSTPATNTIVLLVAELAKRGIETKQVIDIEPDND